jgi:hypothetical protein
VRKLLGILVMVGVVGCGDRGAPADVPPNAATGLPPRDSVAVQRPDTAAGQGDSVMARDTAAVY